MKFGNFLKSIILLGDFKNKMRYNKKIILIFINSLLHDFD